MLIPAELEKDASAAKVDVDADLAALAADARVLETKLNAEKTTLIAFVKTHRAQLIGALIFIAAMITAFIVAK